MTTQGMSPYQSDEKVVEPPKIPKVVSTLPKVIGILHIVIGGVMALSGILGLASGRSQADSLEKNFLSMGVVDADVSPEVLEAVVALDLPSTIVGGLDLITSLVMIVAGVGLLKYAKWGRKLSNIYGVSNLLVKAVNCYVMIVLAAPFYKALVDSVEALEVFGEKGLQSAVVGSIVLSGLYSVVSLVVVNIKSVRSSLR